MVSCNCFQECRRKPGAVLDPLTPGSAQDWPQSGPAGSKHVYISHTGLGGQGLSQDSLMPELILPQPLHFLRTQFYTLYGDNKWRCLQFTLRAVKTEELAGE